jgi:hypothetical protein
MIYKKIIKNMSVALKTILDKTFKGVDVQNEHEKGWRLLYSDSQPKVTIQIRVAEIFLVNRE